MLTSVPLLVQSSKRLKIIDREDRRQRLIWSRIKWRDPTSKGVVSMFRPFMLVAIVLLILASGCTTQPVTMQDIKRDESAETDAGDETAAAGWKDVQLKDVETGETFKVSDFEGKPILLESFAVWCPTCKQQQDQVKKLHEDVGDSVVSISIDTDPTEDEQRVIRHVERHGYNWRFAVDRGGFAKKLIDEFGLNVVNAPSAPVILICENQESRLLRFGVKRAKELQEEIEKGCG